MRTLIVAVAVVFAAILAVSPTIQVTHGALIVDTPYSSFIADGHGVALSVAPHMCGIDAEGAWCE